MNGGKTLVIFGYDVKVYFLLFMIYAILGWIMEVTCKLVQYKRFINRGFLIGPYCPIYGYGALLITILLKRYTSDPIVLFVMAIVVCGTLEYLTSYFMEKIYKARWWDYSTKKFNINGRVCLETVIPFGILGLLIMYILNPFFIGKIEAIPPIILNVLSGILLIIYTCDNIISGIVIRYVKKTEKDLGKELDNTEEITKKVKEIAIKFSGSAGASSSGTFANFFQAIMRIKLPLMTIDEFLKKDKNLFKKLLEGDSNVSKEIRDKVIGAQNEFFKFADKSKISKNPDKEFFEHFKNLYKLSLDMPMVVDKSIGNLSEDLNCICRGKFKLSLKSKIQSKLNKSLESHGKRGKETFVRIFLSKIEDFEDRVEKVFRDNKIGREYLNLEQKKNFNLDKPQIFYKKLTTFDECLNFSNIKNKKKEDRMEKYFSDVYEYIDEILKLKGASVSEKIEVKNPIINIQKDYNKFVDEIQKKALLGPKYLSEWNKKNK